MTLKEEIEVRSVTVMYPCACTSCGAGRPWFYCYYAASRMTARFLVNEDRFAQGLRQIEAQFPNMDYLY